MKLKRVAALLFSVLLLFGGCSQNEGSFELYQEEKVQLLEEAYIYTLPLMIMDATFVKMTNTVSATNVQAPANQFIHAEALATAEFKNVVTPNVDTIYSQIMLDLSDDAVIVEFPKTERYCTVEVIDAYTNCVKIIDAAKFEKESGKFVFAMKGFNKTLPDDMELVEFPTEIGWIIVRTICNSPSDSVNVHEIQNKMKSYTFAQYENGNTEEKALGSFDENNNFVPVERVMAMAPAQYFARANELMANNPPAEADKEFIEKIAKIGVGANLEFKVDIFGEDLEEIWKAMLSKLTETLTANSLEFMTQNGNWSYMGSPIAEFGTEYYYRALIALVGLGANPVSVAVYPKTTFDSEGNRLNGQNSYVLHFESNQLPPVEELGFWSVTAYDSSNNLLIDNEIGRYCINDRSEVVYNEDGSLDILIQSEKPESGEANWLPVSEGDFHLVLRIYFPQKRVLENEWPTPAIIKQ